MTETSTRCPRCILVVDDDQRFRPRLVRAFQSRGLTAHGADGPETALALVSGSDAPAFDGAVVDLRMPGGSGLALIPELLATRPDLRIILLTGYGSISTAVDAVRLGAVDVLLKPADADMILAAFERPTGEARLDAPEYEPPSLARAEWEHIQRVLDDCGGNVSLAARKLGLHRRTLQRKLQKNPPQH